jgi:RNA polymerase sigma factor (sigma-70 family)
MGYVDTGTIDHILNHAGRIPLLTAEEEILLGRRVQALMRLLEDKPDGPYTSAEQRTLRLGKRAKERMITANIRLVIHVAKKYIHRISTLTLADLIQEGSIGLIRGVEKFDPERGYKFSTFGYWWVRQGISRAITRDDRVIRLPISAIEALNKLRGFIPAFVQEHGRQPSYAECAEHCEIAEQTIREYIKHSAPATSLDQRVNSNDDSSMLIDLIAAEAEDPLDDGFWEVRHHLKPVMASLTPEHEEVIQLRFFSQPDTVMSYKLMAEQLGLSRQAIQQREQRALRAMRTRMAIA